MDEGRENHSSGHRWDHRNDPVLPMPLGEHAACIHQALPALLLQGLYRAADPPLVSFIISNVVFIARKSAPSAKPPWAPSVSSGRASTLSRSSSSCDQMSIDTLRRRSVRTRRSSLRPGKSRQSSTFCTRENSSSKISPTVTQRNEPTRTLIPAPSRARLRVKSPLAESLGRLRRNASTASS